MKVRQYILPLLALAALASCGGASSSPADTSHPTGLSTPEASSQASLPSFESFTLSQLHDARVAKSLLSLNRKAVAVKGKVTFAKHFGEDDGLLVIQSGKFALEVAYPSEFNVNVGDSVEAKGLFSAYEVGEVATISLSTYRSSISTSDIKVIDEAISVETVTIAKEADLYEYESSKATINFSVTGTRKNAAFVGKLSEGDTEFIVANKLSVSEKIPEGTFAVGDKLKYEGLFSFSGDATTKVIRYFDKDAFTKLS